MSLKDEIRTIIGNRRKFFLLRICDVDAETARKLCKVKMGTYNTWMQDGRFTTLYRRRDEFSGDYKQEAIQLLRRDNQLNAVLMEEMILEKMKGEIESGEYNLIKTLLARDVYTKLMGDLDYQPENLSLSWEQRYIQLVQGGQSGTVIPETVSSQEEQHTPSLLLTEGEQDNQQIQEAVQT